MKLEVSQAKGFHDPTLAFRASPELSALNQVLQKLPYGPVEDRQHDRWISEAFGKIYTPAKLAGAFPLIQQYAGADRAMSMTTWIELRIGSQRFVVTPEKAGFLDTYPQDEQCVFQYGFLSRLSGRLIAGAMQPKWHPIEVITEVRGNAGEVVNREVSSHAIPLVSDNDFKEAIAKVAYITACDLVLQIPRMVKELQQIHLEPRPINVLLEKKALGIFNWCLNIVERLEHLKVEAGKVESLRSAFRVIDHDAKNIILRIVGRLPTAFNDQTQTLSTDTFLSIIPSIVTDLYGLLCCSGALGIISRPSDAHRDILREFDSPIPYEDAERFLKSACGKRARVDVRGPDVPVPIRSSLVYLAMLGALNALQHGQNSGQKIDDIHLVLTFGTYSAPSKSNPHNKAERDFVAILDNGFGIRGRNVGERHGSPKTAAELAKLFGKETTKPDGKGGFGLSSTLLHLQRYSGELWVASITEESGLVEFSRPKGGPLTKLELQLPKDSGSLFVYSLAREARKSVDRLVTTQTNTNTPLPNETLRLDECVMPRPIPDKTGGVLWSIRERWEGLLRFFSKKKSR